MKRNTDFILDRLPFVKIFVFLWIFNLFCFAGNIDQLKKRADQGDIHAMNDYGWALWSGEGATKDPVESVKYFKRAAERGNAYAQTKYAWALMNGFGVEKNQHDAVAWYEVAAQKGERYAQTGLGYAYFFGKGIEKNREEGLKWLKKGAEQGEPYAKELLTRIENGEEEKITNEHQSEYSIADYKTMAEKGDHDAQSRYGWALLLGKGVEKNPKEAIAWLTQSAESGDSFAQSTLGWAYCAGEGVKKDAKKSHFWYEKAAQLGNDRAKGVVALNYLLGKGVNQNTDMAYKWFQESKNYIPFRFFKESLYIIYYSILINYLCSAVISVLSLFLWLKSNDTFSEICLVETPDHIPINCRAPLLMRIIAVIVIVDTISLCAAVFLISKFSGIENIIRFELYLIIPIFLISIIIFLVLSLRYKISLFNNTLYVQKDLSAFYIETNQIDSFNYEKRKVWFILKNGEKIKVSILLDHWDQLLSRLYKLGVAININLPAKSQ